MDATVKYPIGIQTFEKIREGGFVYVDKTALIYQLANEGQYFFLSRPRRFGKSLMLSTLKAYFEGRKELFNGLAIQRLETEWIEYPVIDISFASYNSDDENSLADILDNNLSRFEEKYGKIRSTDNLAMRLRNVIEAAKDKTGRNAVILIDEYDAPVVAHLGNDSMMEKMRNILKSVYSNLKDMDAYIHFAMLTGVSRFSKMTIFSGLNNIHDISLDSRYSEICGITEAELKANFNEGILRLAAEYQTDYNDALSKLKINFDGYHFTEKSADIYNPFSLLLSLDKSKIAPYWFQSGTPTFLVKRLAMENKPLSEILSPRVPEAAISDIDTYQTSLLSLLFQTGYLTIKEYDIRRQRYSLGIPNHEVETGLYTELLAYNGDMDKLNVQIKMMEIRDAFEDGEPDDALSKIQSFFAAIPAIVTQKDKELYYENNLYMLLRLLGMDVRTEWWTSHGRIDMLIMTSKYVYVMELKLNGTSQEALSQIDTKDYALQWKHDGRKIFKIGISFTSATRNLSDWLISCD